MDFTVTIDLTGQGAQTFNPATDRRNNVFLSLAIDRGTFFANRDLGSRLYLLTRAKCTVRTEGLARDYAAEALAWLLETGRAAAIDIATSRNPEKGRIDMVVTVDWGDGQPVAYQHFVQVV